MGERVQANLLTINTNYEETLKRESMYIQNGYYGRNILGSFLLVLPDNEVNEVFKRFGDFRDGEKVKVKDKNGIWRVATVHNYGKQKMYDVMFVSGKTKHKVTCTQNHRWILRGISPRRKTKATILFIKIYY